MSIARAFALIVGLVYMLVGVLGMFVFQDDEGVRNALREGAPEYLAGRLLGIFPVNMFHSIVHILLGGWGVVAFTHKTLGAARAYALGLAVIYLLLAVLGLIPFSNPGVNSPSSTFGLIPIHGPDVILHGLTGAAAAFVYFASAPGRTTTTTERPAP